MQLIGWCLNNARYDEGEGRVGEGVGNENSIGSMA